MSTETKYLTAEAQLADLGELSGPLIHSFNNLLNTWSLHLAMLRQQSPDSAADLDSLHQQMKEVAAQVRGFQRHRPDSSLTATADFAEVLGAVLDVLYHISADKLGVAIRPGSEKGDNAVHIGVEMAANLPRIRARSTDLERLFRFLLNNAARAAPNSTLLIRVKPEIDNQQLLIQIEDGGSGQSAQRMSQMFDADQADPSGTDGLELSACRSIVRRLNGRINAAAKTGGGMMLTV